MSPDTLATELLDAYAQKRLVAPPAAREGGLALTTAYAVEAEIVRRRAAEGHRPVGWKIGFANRAAWRVLKLDTVVWGRMYDDTVAYATSDTATLGIGAMVAPKIEPEIVFRVAEPSALTGDAAGVLNGVEWIALGYEIIDCVYHDWKFQPADFVASKGLHAALVVGSPHPVTEANRAALAAALGTFTVRLEKGGIVAAEGSGRNVLRNPALSLGELAAALGRTPDAQPLARGDLVSSGTLTESQPLGPGETWTARVDGLDLPPLTLWTS